MLLFFNLVLPKVFLKTLKAGKSLPKQNHPHMLPLMYLVVPKQLLKNLHLNLPVPKLLLLELNHLRTRKENYKLPLSPHVSPPLSPICFLPLSSPYTSTQLPIKMQLYSPTNKPKFRTITQLLFPPSLFSLPPPLHIFSPYIHYESIKHRILFI